MGSLFAANVLGDLIGGIERALGAALAAIYSVTHSYPLAIILLTVAVRSVLIPLTVKQIRSMGAMQTVQPELKKIQQKYKQLQQKANDRTEVQALRMQMNQEMNALYKTHGVNPLGGCFPLIAQFPVLIAMFAIMRASVIVVPVVTGASAAPAPAPTSTATATATPSPAATGSANAAPYGATKDRKSILCRPIDSSGAYEIRADGQTPTQIRCEDLKGTDLGSNNVFTISNLQEGKGGDLKPIAAAPWITQCRPTGVAERPFLCQSAVGTGHLPRDSKLFKDVTLGHASIFGMKPGCSAQQVASKTRAKECSASEPGGTGRAIPYYLLIFTIVGTQYVQGKQMAARATGPQAQQQQMMTKIMPVFLGFISLQLPAGANLYFLTQNLWMIGQQHLLLSKQPVPGGATPPPVAKQPGLMSRLRGPGAAPIDVTPAPKPARTSNGSAKPHPSSKKNKKKKKR